MVRWVALYRVSGENETISQGSQVTASRVPTPPGRMFAVTLRTGYFHQFYKSLQRLCAAAVHDDCRRIIAGVTK